jgi:hypothetical protein
VTVTTAFQPALRLNRAVCVICTGKAPAKFAGALCRTLSVHVYSIVKPGALVKTPGFLLLALNLAGNLHCGTRLYLSNLLTILKEK